jgi:hypothetical protein
MPISDTIILHQPLGITFDFGLAGSKMETRGLSSQLEIGQFAYTKSRQLNGYFNMNNVCPKKRH